MTPAALLRDGTLMALTEGDYRRIMRRVIHEGGQLEGGLALDSGNILSMTGWSAILKDSESSTGPSDTDISTIRKQFHARTGQHYDRVNKEDIKGMLETYPENATKPQLAELVINA